jgi:glycosyltransferase involved in cell wall biosynthesis
VIHFPYQDYVHCKLPSIYNPHDLQHLHFPEYFTAAEIERRENVYPAACRRATRVVVASQFVKDDLIAQYGIDADKIAKIPWALPVSLPISRESATADAAAILQRYECPPQPFILYPAMTWQHKNHLRLFDAIDALRKRGLASPHLICTGYKTDFFDRIRDRLRELRLQDQITFTGIVDSDELSTLYRAAQFVIVPTLFEAASAPLLEAWSHETAVTCSGIPVLVEQAGDAAFFFDPLSDEAIADAIARMSWDANFREALVKKGIRRLQNVTPERTAKTYRAVYRQAAGQPLDEEDRELLNYAQGSR